MRIRVFRNLGKDLPQFTEGCVTDVDDAVGEDLIAKGLAELIVTEPKKIGQPAKKMQAVPDIKQPVAALKTEQP